MSEIVIITSLEYNKKRYAFLLIENLRNFQFKDKKDIAVYAICVNCLHFCL